MSIGIVATLPGIAGLRVLEKSKDKQIAAFVKDPQIKREIDYFKANIGKAVSAEKLVKDERLLRFVLSSYGMEDQTYAKKLMEKILDEGILDPKSTANRMNNPRFKELSKDLGYGETIQGNVKKPALITKIVDNYISQRFEEAVGENDPAMREALYFKRKASTVTSWYNVMGDPALYKVITKALNLPESMGRLDVDRQKQVFESKMDIKSLQDATAVSKMSERYMAMKAAEAAPAVSPVLLGFGSLIDSSSIMVLANSAMNLRRY